MIDSKINEEFALNGFVTISNFFSSEEYNILSTYVENWINQNICNAQNQNSKLIKLPLNNFNIYHDFIVERKIDHSKIASAKFRYIEPPERIIKIIQKKNLFDYLELFTGAKKYVRWQDPGFGWLGYRLIRASSKDGYPPSCKNWGAANNVYSIWLPLAGCTKFSNIRFIPGSHKKTYKSYLPTDSKFTQGEYRLDEDIPETEYIRPEANPRDIIIYHPATIHSEDSIDKEETRLNLEYRFRPDYES